MNYIKYLISFLLIFGLTVNECSVYSQTNSASYQQALYAGTRKEVSHKGSELYVYTGKVLSETILSFVQFAYQTLRDMCSTQTRRSLKLQVELYQKITTMIAQRVFLNKRTTSSNHFQVYI